MRLVTFRYADQGDRAGAYIENDTQIVDLAAGFQRLYSESAPELASVQAMTENQEAALAKAADVIARAPAEAVIARKDAYVRAPIQPPTQMRDFSCFELHLQQCFENASRYKVRKEPDPEAAYQALDKSANEAVIETLHRQPIYYKSNRFAVIGPEDDVIWPSYSRALDFELEWGCYIGDKAKDVTLENARKHMFGYTIFNDITARDAQGLEMPGSLGPAKSKDFDTGNVMGPCLVTPDEIGDPYDLTMIARVNGEEWGRGNTGDMHWTFDDCLVHTSRSETVHSGEFFGSGTVGNGCGFERMTYLKPGDVVELEVAKIGILRTRMTKPD